MRIHLTEQSAEILLTKEEVQTLVEGKEVIGAPSSMFPVGKRIIIVRQAGLEEIRSSHAKRENHPLGASHTM
ncbi:hypothetical protein ES703_97109 [subsurface metagenome]